MFRPRSFAPIPLPLQHLNLSADGTTDPDGNAVSYEWFYYNEASTLQLSDDRSGQPLRIKDFNTPRAWFTVPNARATPPGMGTMHIILAVTDNGSPELTRYRRVIVELK